MDYSAFIINIVIAVIPSIILCLFVYKMDVIEKEPMSMLFRLFFLGILSTIPTAYMEKTIISLTKIEPTDLLTSFIMSFLIVAFIEETYKFLILYLGTWKSKNFNHIYDSIVYAVFISLGFATLENILYVLDNGTQTALLRALVSVPGHAFYAISSGYYLGLAKLNQSIGSKKSSTKWKILSYLMPIILHGTFDFLLFLNNDYMLWVFFGFVALLYIMSFYNIKKVSSVNITCNIQQQDKGGDNNERNI